MATYNITNLVPNVTSGNKSITIEANDGYNLPSSVSVSGGTLVSYNSSTGVAVISGDNAVVSATCVTNITPYITFSSRYPFTLKIYSIKGWDGTLQYSTNTTTWNTWSGAQISATYTGGSYKLYLRGIGNTYIGGDNATNARWVLAGSTTINCVGNIETLLDYQTVISGQHPPMATYCYASLFYNCTYLETAPELPAETLTEHCYNSMFEGCTSLIAAPILPATVLPPTSYAYMFKGCTALTKPAIMAGGTTQASSVMQSPCMRMYYQCTSLKMYTSADNHTPCYKAIAYHTSSPYINTRPGFMASYQMFTGCQIDDVTSTDTYLPAGTQYYC